jgi:hypothetical protein
MQEGADEQRSPAATTVLGDIGIVSQVHHGPRARSDDWRGDNLPPIHDCHSDMPETGTKRHLGHIHQLRVSSCGMSEVKES